MKNQLAMGALALALFPATCLAQPARLAVIAAESAFATQAVQAGSPAAFLANSSPEALVAQDGKLANAQQVWAARPAQANSRRTWYPVLADAAQSNDLGYTTGPWTMTQNDKPQAAGEYVTVWRKQPDGQWKFAVNMSIERVGIPPSKAVEVPQPRLAVATATPSTAPAYVILEVDKRFALAQLAKPGMAYQQYLSAEARLYRPGLSMMQGAAASANMKALDRGYQFVTTGGYLAAAGDLGYVVGTLHRDANPKHTEENGSYLRIWRREATNGWRLVLEVFNFTPSTVAAAAAPASSASGSTAQPGTKRAE